jgi:hypothetical protein
MYSTYQGNLGQIVFRTADVFDTGIQNPFGFVRLIYDVRYKTGA